MGHPGTSLNRPLTL